jgi:magnesium transporter
MPDIYLKKKRLHLHAVSLIALLTQPYINDGCCEKRTNQKYSWQVHMPLTLSEFHSRNRNATSMKYIRRPDKLLANSLKTLSSIGQDFYSSQKQKAKAHAELTFIGEQKVEKVESQRFRFNNSSNIVDTSISDFDFLRSPEEGFNYWVNFHGIHDAQLIEGIGQNMGLERLTIRQILDTTQRPKLEQYDHYLFISIKSITKSVEGLIEVEQISFLLGKQFVVSFQEFSGDYFEDIRDKMKNDVGFIRKRSCDYLLNQLLDAILDNFFITLEQMQKEIEKLEKEIYGNPSKSSLIQLETQKASAQMIKRALYPMKEALQSLMNANSAFIKKEHTKFYKDLASSTITAIEEADSMLRSLEGLSNIYFASLSQNMNEVMKVLTTVATIFIPLTFIAGIYGMNFENIPELRYRYGYFIVWGIMLLVTLGMILYFKKKKWI